MNMKTQGPLDSKDYESLLHGKTLLCYYYLLRKREPVGVRELQRELGFSSPSIASHHLTKLVNWDLVRKRSDNKYELTKIVHFGVLKYFVIIQSQFIPRFAFYFGFYATLLISYLVLLFRYHNLLFTETLFLITLFTVLVFLGYETWYTWNLLNKD